LQSASATPQRWRSTTRRSARRLEHQAQTDAMTGLYNHRYFHERLRAELQRASRSHEPVGVLMLDIDDFKRANDVYGHAIGDEILAQLADTLRSTSRGTDVVCRLGGEEFAVIMPATDSTDSERLAERIQERVAAEEFGPSGRLTLSMGLAEGPDHASNPRELIACAEAAMMTAKARGKNQFVHFADGAHERPEPHSVKTRDVRSISHLKMLQSLATQAEPPQRRARDRHDDRERAPCADRLPQLSRVRRRRRHGRTCGIPR